MNKILVTGATGFIGRYMVNCLLAQNHSVRVLVRDLHKATVLPNNVEVVCADLSQAQSMMGACEGVDTVFHLGGFAHAWSSDDKCLAEQHHIVNFLGTQNIFAEAARAGVKRFVYFSTVKAVADHDECVDEDWDHPPTTPYGLAKRAAETLVLTLGKKHHMHVCVLRPALVYGPHWKGNLARMLRAIDRGLFLPIPETNNRRSMVSLNDITLAALLVAEDPRADGKVYFVTDGVDYSTRQIYEMMLKSLGKPIPRWHIPYLIFKSLAKVGDIWQQVTGWRSPFNAEALDKLFGSAQYSVLRLSQELGFKPQDSLSKLLPAIVTAYQSTRVKRTSAKEIQVF